MEGQGQLQRTHHRYEEDPHHRAGMQSVVEGEGDHNHHGEKKSVLTKVKNKAKKIKDKIKHAGHAHEGDDYDYDEDEETVDGGHVHGAPVVKESEFISGTALPKQTGLNLENPVEERQSRLAGDEIYGDFGDLRKQTGLNLENPLNPLEDRQSRIAGDEIYGDFGANTALPIQTGLNLENRRIAGDDADHVGANTESDRNARNEMYSSIGNDKVIETSPLVEDPYIPNVRKAEYSEAGDVGEIMAKLAMEAPPERRSAVAEPEPMVKIGPLTALEEDPHFPRTDRHLHPPNYETKVSDPTGAAEVDVAPLVDRLGNLRVGESKTEPEEMDYTGSHDHIQKTQSEEMDYTGSHDQFAPQPIPVSDEFNPKSVDDDLVLPRDTVAEKISAATSVIAEKASSAKDMVASKLGYGGSGTQVVDEGPRKGALESVSEKLAPVYEKAAGAGTAIMCKMQRGGVAEESDRGVSVQEYLVEKFSPGEEDRELSKVISSAIRGEGQQEAEEVKERVRVEAVVSDEKAAAGVVDRVKGAIGTWLGKNHRGHPGEGEGLEKEIASKLQE
ncbi:low-temperature-induced 65 kDa protein-like isoform X2 [Salvia hispanica]|uniref:low-temperature-induced 65 kDa protein-like isoform X2 n=1 Tax=Salvia hispanica TaxID=49212 RepID=UPI002008EF8C|nr:low-temperature-induced 65 kDa protein-like isoform X2 [Salvia hispanica]